MCVRVCVRVCVCVCVCVCIYRYHETNVREEHVRKVQLGLFTEIFDDGLDARKTAFECLFTVLERCYDFVTIPEFIQEVSKGLADQHDIQVRTQPPMCTCTRSSCCVLSNTHVPC